jgi:hypothetical protein
MVEPPGENNSVATATPVEVPSVIAGRIEVESDLDCYAFQAKKGEKYSFEVIARRQMSNLDSYLRILNEQGQSIREDDDGRFGKLTHADTWIDGWEAPADGKYIVEIRDGLLRGGAGYEYALQITRTTPYRVLTGWFLFVLCASTDSQARFNYTLTVCHQASSPPVGEFLREKGPMVVSRSTLPRT